ncbi:MAG: hypothetical protein KIG98_05760 [Comamonas sp.]|nr:hypothetical protein [Comamonas sp.]
MPVSWAAAFFCLSIAPAQWAKQAAKQRAKKEPWRQACTPGFCIFNSCLRLLIMGICVKNYKKPLNQSATSYFN